MPINIKVRNNQETSVSGQEYLNADKASRRFLLIMFYVVVVIFVCIPKVY